MVRVWYHSGPEEGVNLSLEDLTERTGVLYYKLNTKTYMKDGTLEQIRTERGYSYEDEIDISPNALPNFVQKVKAFHKEHLHAEEEIRFVLSGTGYFDVRDSVDDSWIRIEVIPGDLLILPAGIYHRLTLIENQLAIKLLRLFLWKPTWSSYYRPAEDLECRVNYLNTFKHGGYEIENDTEDTLSSD